VDGEGLRGARIPRGRRFHHRPAALRHRARLGRELEIHLRAALRNGITKAEIKELLLHGAVYCGAPASLDGFRVAKRVLAEAAKAS
jgi:alkylhydroperoxidase/carboxymuconolactone decarboxylase family protein YurZ